MDTNEPHLVAAGTGACQTPKSFVRGDREVSPGRLRNSSILQKVEVLTWWISPPEKRWVARAGSDLWV